ncbi:6-hydroxymethylpterin diphosphokinase MptE-like protein [Neobacillus rhizosphaerae]|uniref:motility associated factor glycosyltransferase family protein n=1 Tax=Neobacillus rhizosphaerae TaxID=2880965 RepID=UPI003D29DF23
MKIRLEWSQQETKSGDVSVKLIDEEKIFYLHSRYNPRREAENLVEQIDIPPEKDILLIVGIGAGFHVEQFQKKYNKLQLVVIEFNHLYAEWAKKQLSLVKNLVSDGKITFISSTNQDELKAILVSYLSNSSVELFIYKPAIELLQDLHLKLWFKQMRLIRKSYENQKEKMEDNFRQNLLYQNNGLSHFSNPFKNKNFILVSAGPSLIKQLPLLKKLDATEKFVIACVGTSFKLLHQHRISPSFVMISDASDKIGQQFDFQYNKEVPLFFLSTANHDTVCNYRGPKYIIWQEGYRLSEEMSDEKQAPLIKTGGSVATCLLDLSVFLGAKSIALVGQDLAFTDLQTHAHGISCNKTKIRTDSLLAVQDFYRKKKVYTPLNLYTYKVWFENYALTSKGPVELWNCTEGGAYIANWRNEKLQNFADKFVK